MFSKLLLKIKLNSQFNFWFNYYQKEFESKGFKISSEIENSLKSTLLNQTYYDGRGSLSNDGNILLANLLITNFSSKGLTLGFNLSELYEEDPRISDFGRDLYLDSLDVFKEQGGHLRVVCEKENNQLEQILKKADEVIINDGYKIKPFIVGDNNLVWVRTGYCESTILMEQDFAKLKEKFFQPSVEY